MLLLQTSESAYSLYRLEARAALQLQRHRCRASGAHMPRRDAHWHVRIGRLAQQMSLAAGDGEGGKDDEDDAAAEALALAAQISFEEEFQDGDWRARRAQLLAGDDTRWAKQLARNHNAALKGTLTWAHPLDQPEPGAVLLADP